MLKNNKYGYVPLYCQICNDLREIAKDFPQAKLGFFQSFMVYMGYIDENTPRLEFEHSGVYVGTYEFKTDKPYHISIFKDNHNEDKQISMSQEEYSRDALKSLIMRECLGKEVEQLTLF